MTRRTLAAIFCICVPAVVVSAQVKYAPTWDSLDPRPNPAWYDQVKFGIFIHWGVYSVPSFGSKGQYSEWYWSTMQDKNSETWKFHQRVFGKDFAYQDFAPMFKAELFDPDHWATIIARSGARYVILTSKHHDGFCLWPSAQATHTWGRPWNAVDIGPKRDLMGDLAAAVRKQNVRFCFYYSLYEWFNPLYRKDVARYVDEHMLPQLKDAVVRYKPSLIFADGEWDHPSSTWRSPEFLAWLFNDSPVKDEVVANDRWGQECRSTHGGYFTTEYGQVGGGKKLAAAKKWEENRAIGASFGYNRHESVDEYLAYPALLHLLIDTVSRGGNLNLDIGPTADGRIPVIMEERLTQLGAWLKVNGEAIYGTSAGPLQKLPWGCCTAKAPEPAAGKPGRLFLHVYAWPAGKLDVPGLKQKVTAAYLLADPKRASLAVEQTPDGAAVAVPPRPADPVATVVVLETQP